MIVDFHTHTYHSYDSMMDPAKILSIASKRGLTHIVINDHNTIKGGMECKALNRNAGLEVVVGAEIATNAGDVTGIFLKEEINARQFSDVVMEIKKQGGLVILNHPYVGHNLSEINFNGIDLVEGFNSRVDYKKNMLAVELAKQHNKPVIAGSDAHIYSEIGRCRTNYSVSDFLLPDSCEYHRNPFYALTASQLIKSKKKKDFRIFTSTVLGAPKKIWRHLLESNKSHFFKNR